MATWKNLVSMITALAVSSTAFSTTSLSWGLKTHFWIGQQVLNDVLDGDGSIDLAGRKYEVSPAIRDALAAHPEKYRMGNLGPDVFPDPIVGQTTTHPGSKKGWKTDDWLRHLIASADDPEEIATAYGFVSHAAGDIFAHSYVNAYAGDIFILTDDERDVERRHFVLEKYIESLTPIPTDSNGNVIDWKQGIGTSTDYLRDTLILGKEVSKQNSKEGTGLHLSAMYEVRRAVNNIDRETQKVIAKLTDFGADFFKKQAKFQIDLATGKAALEAAELGLKGASELLEVKRKAYQLALDGLSKANEIVQKHPEIITAQQALLAEQAKIAVDAAAESLRVANEVSQFVGGLQGALNDAIDALGNLICDTLFGFLEDCRKLNRKIGELRRKIDVANATRDAVQKAAEIAEKNRDGTKRLIDDLKNEYDNAVKGIANGTLESVVTISEAELRAQERLVEESSKAVAKAKELQEKIAKELKSVTDVVDEIKKVIDKYNLITLLVQNWLGDIDNATGEYIKASHRAGEKMLLNSGNPLSEYKDWLGCYGPVFVGQPIEIGDVTCDVKDFVEELQAKFDEAIEDLPELLQWILFPARTAKKVAFEKLEPELNKAKKEFLGFVTDKTTADFLDLLSNPENATREKLNSVYSEDDSGKNLLKFSDVAQLVENDLSIHDGVISPQNFAPLAHSVTLAKLTLLQPAELNKLIKDLGGDYSSGLYGPETYPSSTSNFTLLLDAVQSIDGNQQWQSFGLPYPRNLGVAHDHPSKTQYGHDFWKDGSKGLRIWVDPYLREKVFFKLFPAPVLGSLRNRPELQWSNYKFPDCAANPFPHTQNPTNGIVLDEDRTCVDSISPNMPLPILSIENPEDYAKRYYQCDQPIIGNQHWAVVGSYGSQKRALNFKSSVESRYPDLAVQVWQPKSYSRYWRVMLASCTTRERAEEAKSIAVRRGIATDAFVKEVAPPWIFPQSP